MAYSIEADIYLALYGSWKDPADEASTPTGRGPTWPRVASGGRHQLADENLGARRRFASDAAMARAEYDLDGLFNSWMGRILMASDLFTDLRNDDAGTPLSSLEARR